MTPSAPPSPPGATLQPPPRRRFPAGALFCALAGLVLLLVLAVEGWRGVRQFDLLQHLASVQDQTLPSALQSQRLVRNLETMRLEGERLLALDTPAERTPSMYVIDVIVASPVLQADDRVAPVVTHARQVLQALLHKTPLSAADRQRWAQASLALAGLSDQITAESIGRISAQIENARRSVTNRFWELGISIAVLTLSLLVFVWVLYQALVRPLRHIGADLAALKRGQGYVQPPTKGGWHPSEIGDIHGAMGQLALLMQENEAIRRNLLTTANTDSLTGLHNRRYFMEQAHLALARAKRTRRPIALAIADLDHFKSINDTLGHEAGDMVLKTVSDRIRSTLRETDIYCRYGGEEFALVFPDTALAEAGVLANRLRESIASTPIPVTGGTTVPISLSLGLVEVGDCPLDQALNRADQAMYRAKLAGRNRIEMGGAAAL